MMSKLYTDTILCVFRDQYQSACPYTKHPSASYAVTYLQAKKMAMSFGETLMSKKFIAERDSVQGLVWDCFKQSLITSKLN